MKRGRNSHAVFESKIGAIAVAWNSKGLVGVQLPEKTTAETAQRLALRAGSSPAPAPKWVKTAVQAVRAMLDGEPACFDDLPLDDEHLPEFHSRVYALLRKLPQGATCTYGELAKAAGSPGAARAVGQAMRKNPWPLVVPCHRVLAAGDRLGGFSASGGVELKATLLRAEAGRPKPAKPAKPTRARTIAVTAKKSNSKSFDPELALKALREQDPRLAPLIDRVPYTLDRSRLGSTFEALLRTIVYQQLNGKAAATIHGRVLDLMPDRRSDPAALLATSPPLLRKAGLSHSKIAAVIDLARRTQAGELPELAELARMPDEEIVERLTVVRGIGRWSVEMLLMFWLARPDVLPVGDFGVRHGFMHLLNKQEMPTPEQLERYAERWRPYRSVASWYMWRVVDEVRATKAEESAVAKPSARSAKKIRAR